MKSDSLILKKFTVFAIFTLLASATLIAEENPQRAPSKRLNCGKNDQFRCRVTPHQTLDTKLFADQVADGLNIIPLVKSGFSLSLADRNGNIVAEIFSGKADEERRFTPHTKSDIGSISKVLTEAATIHWLELVQSAPAYSHCQSTLATPFLDFLPGVYRQVAPNYYEDVSLRNLLNHRAGIPNNLGPDPYGRPYDYWVSMSRPRGFRTCQKNEFCYSNDNYVLATTILPMVSQCRAFGKIPENLCKRGDQREIQTCRINYWFSSQGVLANDIVKKLIFDPIREAASCDYQDLLDSGFTVAKSYPSPSSPGAYPELDRALLHACGVGSWQMSSRTLAKTFRYLHEGSFFLDRSSTTELPASHNGAWEGYRASALDLGDFYVAFLSNRPVDLGRVNETINAAFRDAKTNVNFLRSRNTVINDSRGEWRCQTGDGSISMGLQIYGPNDIRAYHLEDFGGKSSKEIWRIGSDKSRFARGSYIYYESTKSPLGDNTFTGKWSLRYRSKNSRDVTRIDDASGWTGRYRCFRDHARSKVMAFPPQIPQGGSEAGGF